MWIAVAGGQVVFASASGFCAVTGVATLCRTLRKLWSWPRASARVVRYSVSRSEGTEGQKFFHPVIEYETPDGNKVLTISSMGWWRRRWRINSSVVVLYSPVNPRRITVHCFGDLWVFPLTLISLATGCCLLAWFHAGD